MAITADTLIPTPGGWKPADQIALNDIVFDNLGNQVPVRAVQVFDSQTTYEVTFDDGLTLSGDKNMTLVMQDKVWRDKMSNNKKKTTKSRFIIRKMEDLPVEDLRMPDKSRAFSVPTCGAVQYNTKDLPVPPYVFAVWFACTTKLGRMWANKRPMEKIQKIFRGYGFFIRTKKAGNGNLRFDIRPSVRDSFLFAGADIPTTIPISYLESSVEQRIELLEGFCDAGKVRYNKARNKWECRTPDYALIRRIQGLVESLGMKTTLHSPFRDLYYTLSFNKNYDKTTPYGKMRRFIDKIEQKEGQKCVFIDTGTQFLAAEGFISVC
jgi:hypothetical protein